ncbi:MAG: succinate dehydrogenase assembly factor 2 [Rhizobiales bacterium]|nr:succinate dehydrogenase assembly factor 2 [Hyphomicrobiales bacterium]
MNDALIIRKKQLLYRANHRGIKEMDIIIGGYADAFIMDMPVDVLDEFEKIMSELDRDLLTWFVGEVEVPAHIKSPLFDTILQHTIDRQKNK